MSKQEPRVLLSEVDIARRVDELAREISADYEQVEEIYLIGVLKGAFIFLADLSRKLSVPRQVDFIALSSYDGQATSTTEAVRFIMDVRAPLRSQNVLVVEDILDTGYTLDYLLRALRAREPASLKTCVLLQKPDRIEVPIEIDYLGFSIPNEWVVGYGLDHDDLFRTLPYIGVIDPKL
jgi:hypoxanthine phosphoribosyltransferase